MSDQLDVHLAALGARLDADLAALTAAAAAARDAVANGADDLRAFAGAPSPLLAGVPVDDLPPYVPPPSAHVEGALIPDTPLLDGNAGLAFDDAPLWQN